MKVELSFEDEWYPMNGATFPDEEYYHAERAVEVPDDVAERWQRVFSEFRAMQEEIGSFGYAIDEE